MKLSKYKILEKIFAGEKAVDEFLDLCHLKWEIEQKDADYNEIKEHLRAAVVEWVKKALPTFQESMMDFSPCYTCFRFKYGDDVYYIKINNRYRMLEEE